MKIEYSILWFDDQASEIESQIEVVREHLESHGFAMSLDLRKEISEDEIGVLSNKLNQYCRYDLIICDWDMGSNSPDGISIAKKLRSKVFTDIVFYSGKSIAEFRSRLFEEHVDGVFPFDRTQLMRGLKGYLNDHIRRACSANTMRGIVLDEAGRFDRKLRYLCKMILEKMNGESKKEILEKMIKAVDKSNRSKLSKWKGLDCPIPGISNHTLSDFNAVRIRLLALLKNMEESGLLFEDDQSLHELQKLRNRLAHVEWKISADGVMILDDDPSQLFNYDELRKIRVNIRGIEMELTKIIESVTQKLCCDSIVSE